MPRRTDPSIIRAPNSVVAYHGCSLETALGILSGQPLVHSENSYDWLGSGVYFWEYGPFRAAEWARMRYGSGAAVLQARIRLGRCLNLLDPSRFAGLQRAYNLAMSRFGNAGIPLPINRVRVHFLDRMVIESYCEDEAVVAADVYHTVRGCFPEGIPVFPGSRILRETHVQIAVRDAFCISRLRVVSLEQIDRFAFGGP